MSRYFPNGVFGDIAEFDTLSPPYILLMLLIQEKLVVVQANETQVVFVLCGELHNWECLNKWIYGQCHLFTKTNLFSTIFKA